MSVVEHNSTDDRCRLRSVVTSTDRGEQLAVQFDISVALIRKALE